MMFPFQHVGAEWLSYRDRAYLGDEPGLGKTRQALTAAVLRGARHVVVICPAIVKAHWYAEAAALETDFALFSVFSYQYATQNIDAIRKLNPDLLILDEAHFLKHTTSRRTKTLLGAAGFVHQVPTVWMLSGTPMPRNPMELWPALWSLWPEHLLAEGILHQDDFLERYCHYIPSPYGPRIVGVRRADELRTLLAPVLLRRTCDDVGLELPDLRWSVMPLPISDEAMRKARCVDVSADVLAAIEAGTPLPQLASQLATHRRILGKIKAPFAATYIQQLLADGAGPLVVFAYHHDTLDYLAQHTPCMRVDGSTPAKAREQVIETFQAGALPVFLGQISACATGITLTASNRVVIVEPDWSADVNVQAGKRVHRIGQHRAALVEMLAMQGTLDAALVRQFHRERAMVDAVLQ